MNQGAGGGAEAPHGDGPGCEWSQAPGSSRRIVMAIGGLDPSGGAGLAADCRVIRQLGFHPAPVASALTAQGEAGVAWWEPVAAEALIAQVRSVLSTGPVAAVKIGMVGDRALVEPILRAIAGLEALPIVFDPVLEASSGQPLLRGAPAELLPLMRRATVVTPNLPELGLIAGLPVEDLPSMRAAARSLTAKGLRAVLAKGGHLQGPPVDLL
ncbi:MAG: hydroxymethylpyrimidine/phosphomethylpyrimidine kinase, partial [Polyangia bacterium]|nr:hydroxymethylpyrimidine/phosphomethylpyrimidine kinase [Polyangia bacterium]